MAEQRRELRDTSSQLRECAYFLRSRATDALPHVGLPQMF